MNDNYSCTVEVVYVYVYVYVASERTNYMSIFTLLFCSGLGHQHSNYKGANGSRYQSIYERSEPS